MITEKLIYVSDPINKWSALFRLIKKKQTDIIKFLFLLKSGNFFSFRANKNHKV